MARRNAPGLDGLPMEFYLKFWNVLGSDLVNVLNSCFDSGSLSLSQRRGVISLSFKKGDRLDPRNWRPITLLNVDYKLAAPVIAGRLLKVIHLVVDKGQTCGVAGRFIGENVALLRDVANMPRPLVPLLPSFPSIRKRLLIVWTGVSCVPRCLQWGLAHPSSLGSTFSTSVSKVLLMSMVTYCPFLICLGVLDRVVPCLPSFTFSSPRFWLLTSAAIPTYLVFVYLAPHLCPPYHNMLMIPR